MNTPDSISRAQRELRAKARARWLGLEIGNQNDRTFIVTRWNDPSFRFPVMGSATLEEIEEVIRKLEE